MSTTSLLPVNSAGARQHRAGLAVLPVDGQTVMPYAGAQVYFVAGSTPVGLDNLRWQMGMRGGLHLGLFARKASHCCALDTQDGYLSGVVEGAWGKWRGTAEYVHQVAHPGGDGRFADTVERDVSDFLTLSGGYVFSPRLAVTAHASWFQRDFHRDRLFAWGTEGTWQALPWLRLAALVSWNHRGGLPQNLRAKVSYWTDSAVPHDGLTSEPAPFSPQVVPYMLVHYGDHFLNIRNDERPMEVVLGIELAL